MTNTRSTKRALVASIISLMLCFTMLLGTTYAWFTDSVSSTNNIIKSGNLDIELYWSTNAKDWEKVDADTNVFTNNLWEPGHTEVVYLKVVNEGTLALKYQLGVNVANEVGSVNVLGNEFKLSDYIKYGVVDYTTTYTRDEAIAAVEDDATALNVAYNSGTTALVSGAESVVAMVVYMPTTVGNDANYAKDAAVPTINLGINLFATQSEYEKDSFDENYDKDATHEKFVVLTADDLQDALSNAEAGDVIELDADIDLGSGTLVIPAVAATYSMRRAAAAGVTVDLNGNTLTAANVTTEGSAAVVNGELVLPAKGYVYAQGDTAIALENVTITSDGISAYAVSGGTVELKNVKFANTATSNPIQNYGGTMVLEDVTVAQAGDANTAWYSSAIQTINLIAKNNETGKYEIMSQANTTINSGKYIGKKAIMISAPGGNVTINGGTFEGSEFVIQDDFAPQNYTYGDNYTSVITINGGTFVGAIKVSNKVAISITGGTFTADPSAYVADGYKSVKGADGIYYVISDEIAGLVFTADELKTALANGGKYVMMADLALDNNYTLKVPAGVNAVVDMNGKTVSGTSIATGANFDLIDVRGTLTVKNGTITTVHNGTNMEWSNSTNVFNVTAGGVLNLENATVENLGGSDMAFAVHMNNWGKVTLNAENVSFKSTYVGIRVFNSGNDMNNVTLNNCDITTGGSCIWVHNYTADDFGNDANKTAAAAARLNFSFTDTTVARTNGSLSLIRFGFTNAIYYSDIDMTTVVAGTEAAVNWALANGKNIILNCSFDDFSVVATAPYGNYYGIAVNGTVLDGHDYELDFEEGPLKNGKVDNYGIMISGGTVKNVTIDGVFRGIMIMNPTDTVYIDNVVIGGEDVCYTINTGEGDGTQSVVISNSVLKGWLSIGTAVKDVTFTNCTFGQGEYYTDVYGRLVKPYVNTVFENCEFESKYYIDLSAFEGEKVVLKNCTVNGVKITADNWTTLVAPEDSCGEGQISVELKNGTYLTANNVVDYIIFE